MAIQIIVQSEDRVAIYGNSGTIVDHADDANFFTYAEATEDWGLPAGGWGKDGYEAIEFEDGYEFPETFDCSGAWKITGEAGNYSFVAA